MATAPSMPPMRRRRSTFTVGMEVADWASISATPTDGTVTSFLTTLLGGREYHEPDAARLPIRQPGTLKLLFTDIVGAMDEAAQIQVLDALINLVRNSCGNVEACASAGLQREILQFLSDRGLFPDPFVSNQVLKKILRLFLYLANHSVTSDDIRAMLGVFRSQRMTHEDPDDQAISYYVSTLEMIARDSFGPGDFFDLSGEYSGLVLPVLEAFPSNGYTFCAWLKFECLPDTAAPLFTFCGRTDVGIMCSFIRSSLAITCFDKKKNDSHVEIPDLITPGRWHFLSIVHTHRQIRGSKLDIYLNSELRHSTKLTYPNTALMAPVVKSYIAMRERDREPSLKVLLGPTALFGQPLPSNIISNVKSADEYDALVFQFNSYISSSTSTASVPGATTSSPSTLSTIGGDGLLFAYDARNCDRSRGICFDSSGNDNHAEAASTGVRLRRVGTFKQSVAQLGGPLVCLPLLVTATNASALPVGDVSQAIAQFDEDSDFLLQMANMIARPLGVRSIPKVILMIAEIMRHSLVNKFIFRRHQGVRLTALLLRSLPPRYLTPDLLLSIERFRSAVISDRILADEIYKFLLFNFRIWVNAPTELQQTVFDKLEDITRRDVTSSSAVSTRHFLRCLSWIYWKYPSLTTLRRSREFSESEINSLRRRVLSIVKLELCEAQPVKTSVIGRGAKAKEVKTQLSYESTRSLIFCMIGKPTNPMSSGLNADGTPSLQDSGDVQNPRDLKNLSDGEADAGSVVENVPEADLPDLIELLIELSLQPTAPAGLLDLFGRLGGLRIWLPLLSFSSNTLRVMTMRLLRTYLTLKCQCVQDRDRVTSSEKIQLSVGDAFLILNALNAAGHPVTMGVYSEVLLLILGMQVSEDEMKAPGSFSEDYEALIDEEKLAGLMIWHTNMMFPFLEMVRASSLAIRLVAIRHLKILFASPTPASAINRNMLIYNSISTSGALTVSSTTEQTPIIEAILSLRGDKRMEVHEPRQPPNNLFGITLEGCPGATLSRLRELVLNSSESDEARVNALYSIISLDDVEFVASLFTVQSELERKKHGYGTIFRDMPNRTKVATFEMMACLQPQGCSEFITQTAYEIISSIVTMESKTNDMSWILLQDPFTSLSRFIDSAQELEIVVVTLLKSTLDKMNELLSVEINLRGHDGMPSRESVLWRNAENLATLAAAVVLHYDPDTLGSSNPSTIDSSEIQSCPVYWKCERILWHESDLLDSILGVWQHFASTFHSEKDASFGRKPNRSLGVSLASASAGLTRSENGSQSPPPIGINSGSGRRDSKNGPPRGIGFGFNLLSVPGGFGGSHGTVTMRPHPGGPMRQVLQLLLRSFYLVLSQQEETTTASGSVTATGLQASSVFLARINKLEYYINAMSLGRDTAQFESSFTPSRTGSGNIGISGLIGVSKHVRAAPGDETSLLLWFVPELASLISRVRAKLWSDSAVKLASILANLVTLPLRSSEDLIALLNQTDFVSSNQEVCRRDGFYFEQMAHARESRSQRRNTMMNRELDEKAKAQAELDRISRSTRSQSSAFTLSKSRSPGIGGADDADAPPAEVWLQRVKAKDIDDWMRLRVLLKWGVRHVWSSLSELPDIEGDASGDGHAANALTDALSKNEFWRLDSYTSSNWIRTRLLPDTDDTLADFADYIQATLSAGPSGAPENFEALSVTAADAMKAHSDEEEIIEVNGFADGGDEDDEDEVLFNTEDILDSAMDTLGDSYDDAELEELSPDGTRPSAGMGSGRRVRSDTGGLMGIDQTLSETSKPQDSQSLNDTMQSTVHTSSGASEPDRIVERRSESYVTTDVANSVRAANREKPTRIGAFSSRFSSGIRMLTGSRSSRGGEEDKIGDAAAAAGAPTLWRRQSGPAALDTSTVPAPDVSTVDQPETSDPQNPLGVVTSENSEVTPDVMPRSSNVSSSDAKLKRQLRGTPSMSDQWKNLGGCYRTKAYLALPSGLLVYGMLRIGSTTIVFEGEYVTTLKKLSELTDDTTVEVNLGDSFVSELRRRVWGVRVIRVVHRRRFLLNPHNGIELYFVDGSSCLLGFEGHEEADLVYATLRERKPPCLAKWGKRLVSAERLFAKSKWTEMWVRREISNFEYLMVLNVSAGRSYSDLTQYPIFPWILRDYDSEHLQLDDPAIFRDLTKPIGVQTSVGSERAQALFQSWNSESLVPAHHFATASSHMKSVFYFLCRLAPITSAFAVDGLDIETCLTSGVFRSVADAFKTVTEAEGYHYELTPEFFFLPDFLVSDRNKQLTHGHENVDGNSSLFADLQKGVQLPRWASTPHDFIRQHRLALESDYVSEHLHHWIDLMFGYRQNGRGAIESQNSYHIACYPEKLDLSVLNVSARAKLTMRGTLPIQLFRKPHPARMTQDESLEARYPASHSLAALSSRRQVRRHDLMSKHASSIVSMRFTSALNSSVGMSGPGLGSGTGIGAHSSGQAEHGVVVYMSDNTGVVSAKRYLNAIPDQARICPFTLVDVDQWWKLPSGSLARDGVVFYEQMISCGYWDGSWRIHWSADGELLQRIAFHKKPILCMACSEDDFTGDLALAFGSEDCTVSIWALSKMSATRSRRLFVKKELPVGGLPWVLLHGHTTPVVAVALNVDLDVVVSSSRDNTILVHSLRSATPLHNIEIASPHRSIVTYLTISNHGDTLVHSVRNRQHSNLRDAALIAEDINADREQSELYLVSLNGVLVSRDLIVSADGEPTVLLDRAAFFTRSAEYIITAVGGSDGVLEVRDAGSPSVIARRIECKRASDLTCVSMSQDERCILCGYADGSVVAYALHYGVADGCKNQMGLDRKAREQEAQALAKADMRDQQRKEAEDRKNMLKWGGTSSHTGLWIRQGKTAMPSELLLTVMQDYFTLLKQSCVADDPAYEILLKELWTAMYAPSPSMPHSHVTKAVPNLMDIPLEPVVPFERSGPTWSRLGFQRPDPTTDFRAGGMLSLKSLVYFACHYHEHACRMVEHQVPGSRDNTYPWGPAGINLTCMLARTFWSGDGCLSKERSINWPFFEDKDAFFVVFSEVFLLFDHLWVEMNAHYGVFSDVMQATTGVVLDALEEAKADLQTFLVEIRAQSLSNSGRKGRAASRSMEEFLVSMSSTIASPDTSGLRTSFVSATPGSTRGSESSKNVGNLIDLGSPPRPVAKRTSSFSSAPRSTLANPSLDFDPFAGNDITGLEVDHPPRDEDSSTPDTDDPFAGLP